MQAAMDPVALKKAYDFLDSELRAELNSDPKKGKARSNQGKAGANPTQIPPAKSPDTTGQIED